MIAVMGIKVIAMKVMTDSDDHDDCNKEIDDEEATCTTKGVLPKSGFLSLLIMRSVEVAETGEAPAPGGRTRLPRMA